MDSLATRAARPPLNRSKVQEVLYGHKSGGFSGYSHLTGGYAGGQADYARVPFGEPTLWRSPPDPSRSSAHAHALVCSRPRCPNNAQRT